jgi:hypothetical protein
MSKEYKILDVQEDGLFFPNNDEVAYSDMKRVLFIGASFSKRLFTVEDDIYGGNKLIIRGKKHLLFLYNDGRLESKRYH